jgi:hypothetical protein
MTIRQKQIRLARRRHHQRTQDAKRKTALVRCQEAARKQKKGGAAVASLMNREGYTFRERTHIRVVRDETGVETTRAVKTGRWKRAPR